MPHEVDLQSAYTAAMKRLSKTTEALVLAEAAVDVLTGRLEEVTRGQESGGDAEDVGGGDLASGFSD